MTLEKDIINKIEHTLIQQKNFLIQKACKDQDIEIDVDGDEFDEIQGNLLISINNELNSRNILKINQINDALQRIKTNKYGLCEDCGEGIPYKRLLFNPYLTTCVCCAEDREMELKQQRKESRP